MKKILFLIVITLLTVCQLSANTELDNKKNARFISEKMTSELSLNDEQLEDVYEINYDFIIAITQIMEPALQGNEQAISRYYALLNVRNEHLRLVLDKKQYEYFLKTDYLYRPVYCYKNTWDYRIYTAYKDREKMRAQAPKAFNRYHGERTQQGNSAQYYQGRHKHETYGKRTDITKSKDFEKFKTIDFYSYAEKGIQQQKEKASKQEQKSDAKDKAKQPIKGNAVKK